MYKRENHSLAKINKQLTLALSRWMQEHIDIDPRLLTIKICELHTSKDLAHCQVLVYHNEEVDELVKKLNRHSHPIHQYLFNNLRIRRVPKIKFKASERLSREEELNAILNEIES